ncbi:hypothetical protein GOP47_0021330 [Adiantum capillus-veneris]|uniref:Pentatricopeptide repeat-containing protein n=1 Tax=Adiantum capillus-veneris TaxID=13818 RepID=A0A9D4Z8D7_ADICA|nr:hypothetical protein GOP47_0021330 [Adiantum capillus-veneris]
MSATISTRTVFHPQHVSFILFSFRIALVSRCVAEVRAFSCKPVFILSAHYSLSSADSMVSWDSVVQSAHVETLVLILNHCRKQRNPHFALITYTFACEQAAEMHPCLGNYLIPMLADCGKLDVAQQVFDKLIQVNEHSCQALILGYVSCENYDRAFFILDIMRERQLNPSMFALQALVKAAAKQRCLTRGQKLHLDIVHVGCEKVSFVSITLVDMYAKCNSLQEAQEVFDEMDVQEVVPWNALLSGYISLGLYEAALDCYCRMKVDMVDPDACTFLCCLKACCNIRDLERGQEIHAEIVQEGLEGELYLHSALVDIYAKCGSMDEAQDIFDEVTERDVVSWNVLITGYSERGLAAKVLIFSEQMEFDGVLPSPVTYVCCLAACGNLGFISQGQEIHGRTVKEGVDVESHVGSALIDMYARFGLLSEAKEAFQKLRARDAVSWTSLITAYADAGLADESLDCLEQMMSEGVTPDSITYCCCLKACGSSVSVGRAQRLHNLIEVEGHDENLHVCSSLVDVYAKCGLLEEAADLFEELPIQDVILWNSLLAGYAFRGDSNQVVCLVNRMISRGIIPNDITSLNVLIGCSHAGLIDDGLQLFCVMKEGFHIPDTTNHYTAIVDLVARAGQLDEAVAIMESMYLEPDAAGWTAILAACQNLGNVELARQAFDFAMDMDDTQTALFILMSKCYSNITGKREGSSYENEACKQV